MTRRKVNLAGALAIVVLALLTSALVVLFGIGNHGWSCMTFGYSDRLVEMPPSLQQAMPKSAPIGAQGARVYCRAGFLQDRGELGMRFIVPVAEAKKIAATAAETERRIGTGGWDLTQNYLLETLAKRPLPSGVRGYVIAHQESRHGITAVIVDESTGEIIYLCCPD